MAHRKNTPKKGLKAYNDQDNSILGLDAFKLKLEKDFFCDVNIRNAQSSLLSNNLILETKFNFNLYDGLSLLANRRIGDLDLDIEKKNECLFLTALENLDELNNKTIDIEELNIIFNDCTIIIHRIFENSIAFQINNLISELYKNQIFYTQEYTKTPYEIHIPVFEESPFDVDYSVLNIKTKTNHGHDYFAFWGLYFEDCVDSAIFDFGNKNIIDGELTMVNY